ncbi:YbaB/EbfC family nucleoid-associated protein [Patescibacteria group bacterium]|nr:YbaB/EbfC family nucleoid-associated protein [Patescibacteria group bacterium]
MFDKFKQLKNLKDMQEAMEKEAITVARQGVEITINGKFEVQEVSINPKLEKKEQEIVIKQCFNEAVKKLQMNLAQKFSGML